MIDPPPTRYARNGDVHLAYQVLGDGPVDLVFFGTFVSHVELVWEDPDAARFLERLASFTRLIVFDKRGVGMSDPAASQQPPTLEERLDDVRAVMDAAGSDQAVLFGTSEGGQLAVLFATTFPGRTRAVAMFSASPRARLAPDYPIGLPDDLLEWALRSTADRWGEPAMVSWIMPSVAEDPHRLAWWTRFVRRSSSPGAAVNQVRMNLDSDVRHLLPLVKAPTLVMHAREDRWIPFAHGRYFADHIPGARFVELPGGDHLPFGELGPLIADELREFLTGERAPVDADRVLATVLFSDIVGSTRRAANEGDERWRRILDDHDRAVLRQVERFGGRRVKSTGDGALALFDGPARAIRCGVAIAEAARALGLDVRVGVHTGEVELRDDDIAGIAVHIGARVAALAGPGEVLVSGAVPPLVVGSGLAFRDLGERELDGVPERWRLLAVDVA